jgi:hypothetical protein
VFSSFGALLRDLELLRKNGEKMGVSQLKAPPEGLERELNR